MTTAIAIMFSIALDLAIGAPWRFAVIGDTQANWHVARRAYAQMRNVWGVVHLGDIWTCASERRWGFFDDGESGVASIPTRYVIGNHELFNCRTKRYQPRRWRKRFNYHFRREMVFKKTPECTCRKCGCCIVKSSCQTGWKYGPTYKTFQYGRYSCPLRPPLMIMIDSATPGISGHQLLWLKKTLEEAKDPVMLFSHRPFPSKELRYVKWFRAMDPMPYRWRNVKLWQLLQKHKRKILAMFHGHWHGFRQYIADGLKVWCDGRGGGDPAPGQRYGWSLVTVWGDRFWVEKKEVKL